MPIYEFCCESCHHIFEELILNGDDEKSVVCPNCKGKSLKRVFSVFGVAGTEKKVQSSTAKSSCSHCSSHNCSSCS